MEMAARSPGDGTGRGRYLTLLAPVPTPLLLFVSSSSSLYLKNQDDLGYQMAVLLPFAASFFLLWCGGVTLQRLASRRAFRYPLWAYYLIGPFVLVHRFLLGASERNPILLLLGSGWLGDSFLGLGLWIALLATAVVFLGRRMEPRRAVPPLAVFGILLLLGEGYSFATQFRVPGSGSTVSPAFRASSVVSAPNVYHVVLDSLQTDVLELAAASELRGRLGGFVSFPRNHALYHGTTMSLASTFASRRYAYRESRRSFVDESMGADSFVARLRRQGFHTFAFVPASDKLPAGVFGAVVSHSENFELDPTTNTSIFIKLWLVAHAPRPVREWMLGSDWLSEATREELRLIARGGALADSAPVASYLSYRQILAEEERLSARGRYSFIHLLIPHSPFLLSADCSHRKGSSGSGPVAQTRCAVRLLIDLADRLESLGRFEESLIVVHGDHGGPFRLRDGELVLSRARSLSTPLLIKPSGRTRSDPFAVCERETSLLDVAPTVLDLAGLPVERAMEGVSLARALERCGREAVSVPTSTR